MRPKYLLLSMAFLLIATAAANSSHSAQSKKKDLLSLVSVKRIVINSDEVKSRKIILMLRFKNLGEDDIEAFTAKLGVFDKFGSPLGLYGLKSIGKIPSQKERTGKWIFYWTDTPRNKNQEIFVSPPENLAYKFTPIKITFNSQIKSLKEDYVKEQSREGIGGGIGEAISIQIN